ncbi:hypothetical protein K439DRAFT_1556860 [Ramaria rubella]|nr:hypothetical protein K439DRAFT_1556860 [Ramaria rubella]
MAHLVFSLLSLFYPQPYHLNCLIYGDEPAYGRIFPVNIMPTEMVTELRLKIRDKIKHQNSNVDMKNIILYRPNTALSTTSKTTFDEAIAQLTADINGKATLLKTTSTVVESGLPQPVKDHVHIFIVILSNNITQLLMNTILMVPETSSLGTERGDNNQFKLNLYKFYWDSKAVKYPNTLTCSLTGVTMSSKAIVAAHLWKHAMGMTSDWFGFDNIDNPRNGLLLYKPIEEAYDRHLLCFYQDDNKNLRCRILSENLQNLTFNEFFTTNRKKRPSKATDIEPSEVQKSSPLLQQAGFSTFADLERPETFLQYPPTKEPFKRVLNLHAIRAYNMAMKRGDPAATHFDFKDFYSNDQHYNGRTVIEEWRKGITNSPD